LEPIQIVRVDQMHAPVGVPRWRPSLPVPTGASKVICLRRSVPSLRAPFLLARGCWPSQRHRLIRDPLDRSWSRISHWCGSQGFSGQLPRREMSRGHRHVPVSTNQPAASARPG
jgi:hypothetical protein